MDSSSDCTPGRCLHLFFTSESSLASNVVFLALFALLIPVTLGLGVKYRGSIFATAVATGLALEVLGYVGRVILLPHHDFHPSASAFALFLTGTTTAPTLICGAVFLAATRVVVVYGEEFRTWRPVWYQLFFYGLITAAFVLEVAGSVLSAVGESAEQVDTGAHVLIAGLVIQLVALVIFVGHGTLFAISVLLKRHSLDPKFAGIYTGASFKALLSALSFAILLLVIRTAYRIIAVAEGYSSSVARSETLFLILDGLMVLLAILALLAFFPGRVLGELALAAPAQRLPEFPLRHAHPLPPYDLPPVRYSPTHHQVAIGSLTTIPFQPKQHSEASQPGTSLVDRDTLW
ncbi:RTA1 like protein-domain-containing protein [Durotheca rogersii]|uniref:RTA1 like protein-domain-containing protein n=1 Tax=Durotheca rogersii TaxID=419775 RepID=UPI0022204AF2|nr:RTA1 like protein-domain-containing protein [Durotheca rogersii]KAI5855008.1 RTA1 like protein-domain-containing protein [Durotheca rogersii]